MVASEQEKKANQTAPETPAEEIKAEAEAKEKEILCVDLIKFTKELINKSSKESGK